MSEIIYLFTNILLDVREVLLHRRDLTIEDKRFVRRL